MVKQKREKKAASAPVETPVEEKTSTLKKSTIVTGVLLLGAAAVWGVLGYQAMSRNTGESFLDKYFHEEKNNDVVVAKIDGENVYLGDIKAIADQIPQLAELPFDMIYPQLLQKYLVKQAVYKSAINADVLKDPVVQIGIKEAQSRIVSEAYLEKIMSDLATPEKLNELYQSEMATMERPEEVHARHILVKTEKEAHDIWVQLEAGADFEMLADANTMEDEPKNGGDLGYFQKNMMIPEFGEAAFSVKVGKYSAPVKTPFGWHIIKVEDRRIAPLPTLESVQDQLRALLYERSLPEVLNNEREKHNVQVLVPTLRQQSDTASEIEALQNQIAEEVAMDDAAAAQAVADKALEPVAADTPEQAQ